MTPPMAQAISISTMMLMGAELAAIVRFGEIRKLRYSPTEHNQSDLSRCCNSRPPIEQIQFLLGHMSVQTTERYQGASSGFIMP